jgi:hypothetical protein
MTPFREKARMKISVTCDRSTDGQAILCVDGKDYYFGNELGLAREIEQALTSVREETILECAKIAKNHDKSCHGIVCADCAEVICLQIESILPAKNLKNTKGENK